MKLSSLHYCMLIILLFSVAQRDDLESSKEFLPVLKSIL